MIFGKLNILYLYKNLHPNFAVAIDWLLKQDIEQLSHGKHEIKSNEVFAVRMKTQSYDDSDVQYEVHHEYADIQVVLDPEEKFYYDNYDEMKNRKTQYDAKDDVELFELDSTQFLLSLRKHDFLVFWPYEPHAPKYVGKIRPLEKIIVKVKVK